MGRPSRTLQSVVEELLAKAIPNGDCLECHLSSCSGGYPQTYYGRASRIVYTIKKGPIGKLWVLHTCDNKQCINPEHLFLGTCQDNVDDMRAKGRSNYVAIKVTTPEKRERMRRLQGEGKTYKEIAAICMVSKNTVWRCLRGDYD